MLSLSTPVEAKNLQLAVLLGCETGQDINDKSNILRRFSEIGAEKSIGFNQKVLKILAADRWNKSFWKYAVQEDMEVSDAAFKAANEEIWGFYWLPPSYITVIGEEEVYLKPRRAVDPQFIEPTPLALQQPTPQANTNPIQQAQQGVQDWFDEQGQRVEQAFRDLEESLREEFNRAIREAIADALRQICLVPIGLVLFVGVFINKRLRR